MTPEEPRLALETQLAEEKKARASMEQALRHLAGMHRQVAEANHGMAKVWNAYLAKAQQETERLRSLLYEVKQRCCPRCKGLFAEMGDKHG